MTYLSLFALALIAATLLPAQSEAALVALLLDGGSVWGLVAAASAGNVLGSLINWWIGREVTRFQGRRWFPIKPSALLRAQAWYGRYGKWSLLLSWMPIIGDPLYGGALKLTKGATDTLVAELRGFKRQALHAETLEFLHPVSGEPVRASAPVPEDLQRLMSALREDSARAAELARR